MRTCHKADFAVLADHRAKIKESETRDKYLYYAKEVRKQWNMKVQVMSIVTGALGMFPKSLERGYKSWKLDDHSKTFKLQHF